MKKLTFLVVTFFLTGCNKMMPSLISAKRATPDTRPGVFVMMGQSNMTGLSAYAGPKPESKFIFANDIGSGPGVSIAEGLNYANRVIMVNCAVGGTFMDQWVPGQPLYNQCIEKVRAAVHDYNGVVKGMFFLQGEADTLSSGDDRTTYDWAMSFTTIVHSFRSIVGPVDVVYGQLGQFHEDMSGFPNYQHIKDEQASVSLPNCTMIKTDDLELFDGLHHTPAAYKIMGQRFADAWNKLILGE